MGWVRGRGDKGVGRRWEGVVVVVGEFGRAKKENVWRVGDKDKRRRDGKKKYKEKDQRTGPRD